MKLKIVLWLGILLAASPALAESPSVDTPTPPPAAAAPAPPPPSIVITDQDKQVWVQLVSAFDQCLGASFANGNHAICAFVENYLTGFSARVAASK